MLLRTGALRARLVRLVQPAMVEKTRGLIKSLKESFGFIERADVVDDVRSMPLVIIALIFCIDILSLQ